MALAEVLERIEAACRRHGRDPGEVNLLAVSKTFPVEAIEKVIQSGISHLGENYVQEAASKIPRLRDPHRPLHWHLIGPLQSNKAGQAVALFDTIHSLDRLSLAQRLEQKSPQPISAFVQVHLGDEPSKSGLAPQDLLPELERWNALNFQRLRLVGLMTIPPPQQSVRYFEQLRHLRDRLQAQAWPLFSQYQLSMGMSEDFEEAIGQGSNWVRIGRAIFGSRPLREL